MRILFLLAGVTATTAAYVKGKAFDRFITIWLENQDFSKVSENTDIVDLHKEGVSLTNYYGLTHPSQPNYIASICGDYFGLNHDELIKIPSNVTTVVDLFEARNIEWKGYFESIPGPGYMGEWGTDKADGGWDYVRKHNPFVSFDRIRQNGTRLAQLQSFKSFQRDVAANKLPQYAHLSPNMLNDGHNTSLSFATTWTKSFLTPLLANPKFMENTLILLTYDESETYSKPNKIVSLLLGGAVPQKLKGTSDDTVYSHYSILSTLENNFELPTLGRYDAGANVFDLVAAKTGYKNHPLPPPSSPNQPINNSLSYMGFLNNKPNGWLKLPPPNLQLKGAGSMGPERMTKILWITRDKETTPYDGSGILYDGGSGTEESEKVREPVYKAQAPELVPVKGR
ncbi:related to acid phosphatase Pho610 [Rhynchosporium secalis]|uniref:Related to acid phosphatase Pho610 n=1 Tax=Rhynchosporium secalis TaxID=38038 RepID=A0A1E1M4C1_RHYSE|nr:related to acid phosphatase Pho610 [Rhynchosporium secalis]